MSADAVVAVHRSARALLISTLASAEQTQALVKKVDAGDLPRSVVEAFQRVVGVPGRFNWVCHAWMDTDVNLGTLRYHITGTRLMGLVVIAAAVGPQGPFAKEVLALAGLIHAQGWVRES